MKHVDLEKFANGAFSAQVNRAIEEVTENIQNPKGLNCSLQKRDTIEMDALQAIPVIENYQLPIFLRDSIWKRNLERRSKP